MIRLSGMALLGLALLASACASTDQPAADTQELSEGSQRECRNTSSAGSRMRQSDCRTKDEWALADARDQAREDIRGEFFRRVGETSTVGPGGNTFLNPISSGL